MSHRPPRWQRPEEKILPGPMKLRAAHLRLSLALLVAAFLAGCAVRDVVSGQPLPGYVEDAAARVAAVDWSRAETVRIRLDEFAFQPSALSFRAGTPYRLLIENVGAVTHSFVAEGFFKAIAVEKLSGGGIEELVPFVKTIAVPPHELKELSFIAVKPGAYRLECTVPGHSLFGMTGEITVR